MNDLATTHSQLAAMVKVARDMGLGIDELGHPYRIQPEGACVDFDPLNNPADAFRVQVHYNLALEQDNDLVMVRDGKGPILVIEQIYDLTSDGRVRACAEAILHAAAKTIFNRDKRNAAGAAN